MGKPRPIEKKFPPNPVVAIFATFGSVSYDCTQLWEIGPKIT